MDSKQVNQHDLSKYTELIVTDYLRQNGYTRTLDQFLSHPKDTVSSSAMASEIYSTDTFEKKENGKSKSVLEHITSYQLKDSTSTSSKQKIFEKSTSSSTWSKQEILTLKQAIKKTTDINLKSERWKLVSKMMDNAKSKRECYEKYKELKNEKKQSKEKLESTIAKTVKIATPTTDECKSHSDNKKADEIQITSNVPDDRVDCNYKSNKAIIVEDFDDFDCFDLNTPPSQQPNQVFPRKAPGNCRSITVEEAISVRKLFFGDTKKVLSSEWLQQGFYFNAVQGLEYGLVQAKGGPCGVLAVVQAYVIKYLRHSPKSTSNFKNFSDSDLNTALTNALAQIIWNSGDDTKCCVALHDKLAFSNSSSYKGDGLTERIAIHTVSSLLDAKNVLSSNLKQFTAKNGAGVVLLVYSAIFSRKLGSVISDMDVATGTVPTLIGSHNYCTQEMVNLLLCGQASTNVFNGNKTLGDDQDKMILHGIPKKCELGFLTLFEAYEYMEVGSHLKDPCYPIWVICSESHYSVMFKVSENRNEKEFDVEYYDGLANQNEVITLSINSNGLDAPIRPDFEELVPPLNLVIRTKWPLATVNWHDVEPIL